jgi:thiamine biosynthesis lipoprotein
MDGGLNQDGRGRAGSGQATTWYARSKLGLRPRALQREQSGAALWPVWNTTLHLTVTSRDHLTDARNLVIDQVAAIDDACNPYLPDSEIRALQRAQGQQVRVSALLAELVAVSLRAAVLSDGGLDPISGGPPREHDRGPHGTPARGPVPLWQRIQRIGRDLTVPAGALLDLSDMVGAHTVDRCARLIHERFKIGVRVGIGGDVAMAGPAPVCGWETLMVTSQTDHAGPVVPVQPAEIRFATSRTVSQRWPSSDGPLRYTFRPGTNRAVVSVWRSVSVAGFPCTYAKALSMTAMMRGHAAPDWLRGLGASARLVAANGEVITVGRWPAHEIG